MRLTTKGRYAVTAMLDLAIHSDGPVSLADIAQRQTISQAYLEQLFAKLRRHALVNSIRGPGGGYALGRSSQSITVADIVEAVDESIDATRCGGQDNCQHGEVCLTHYLWCDLNEEIQHFLRGITLASLVERREMQIVAARQKKNVAAVISPPLIR